jgi:hypothetical protein
MVRRGCRCISQLLQLTTPESDVLILFRQLGFDAPEVVGVLCSHGGCRCALLHFAVEGHVFMVPSVPEPIVKISFVESCLITLRKHNCQHVDS